MRRVVVNPEAPHRDAVQEAAARIIRGGVVAIPTDTLYGLAVDPFNRDAVARLYEVKGRPADRALPLIAADAEQVAATIGALTANNDLLTRAIIQNEFRSAADLVDRVSGGAGPGGVKAVAPTGTESIVITIPAEIGRAHV